MESKRKDQNVSLQEFVLPLIIGTLPALITAGCSYLGMKKSADTSLAVFKTETNMEIAQLKNEIRELKDDFADLAKHVRDHNNLAIRTSVLEQRAIATEDRLKELERSA